MFTNLLLALVTAVPALADNQIKPKNTDSDLCIDNTNGVLIDGNPLQVSVILSVRPFFCNSPSQLDLLPRQHKPRLGLQPGPCRSHPV